MFHIGQKVVCINDNPGIFTGRQTLKKGNIYTIRGFCTEGGHLGIHLEEVILENYGFYSLWAHLEISYKPDRFRPAITKGTETGIAILKKIAADQSKKQVIPITESVD